MPSPVEPWFQKHWANPALAEAVYTLRIAREPMLALRAVSTIVRESEAILTDAVADCRTEGRSWEEIAEALGVTRQSAHRKYAPATEREDHVSRS
jgi:hypothetical protein